MQQYRFGRAMQPRAVLLSIYESSRHGTALASGLHRIRYTRDLLAFTDAFDCCLVPILRIGVKRGEKGPGKMESSPVIRSKSERGRRMRNTVAVPPGPILLSLNLPVE